MSSIGTLLPSGQSATGGSTTPGPSGTSLASASGTDALANQSTFLQLLVAQLKNQNPSQPMDGTTFVTQLAQFSDLEQNLGSRQDLDGLSQKILGTVPSAGSSAASSNTSTGGSSAPSGVSSTSGTANNG